LLANDPLLELRLIPPEQAIGRPPAGPWLWEQIQALGSKTELLKFLETIALSSIWGTFSILVSQDVEWQEVVKNIVQQRPAVSDKVARAVVAAFQIYVRERSYPGLTGEQRDRLTNLITELLGGPALGVADWFLQRLTKFGVRRRGQLSDTHGSKIGDVLRYQARGQEIRNFIELKVATSSASVILAHSLGGIAAVDLLASKPTAIELLITAGTQAPFLYEIDAMVSTPFGTGLPNWFPRWINFVDSRDFLSYLAAPLFPGVAVDKWVDNGQPFPDSHAYWNNDEVWKTVQDILATI
jgi:hypothetical protein